MSEIKRILDRRREEIGPRIAQSIARHKGILEKLEPHLGRIDLDRLARSLKRGSRR